MTPRVRLLLASGLFVAWIAYLAFLVWITRQPVILSRPQFLVADLYVIAEIDGDASPNAAITVKNVAWARDAGEKGALEGKKIDVDSLGSLRNVVEETGKERNTGWSGPGTYILPLDRRDGRYVLTHIPRSPGYSPDPKSGADLRIYRATDQARAQLKQLIERFH